MSEPVPVLLPEEQAVRDTVWLELPLTVLLALLVLQREAERDWQPEGE